jgi:hypothetical protein
VSAENRDKNGRDPGNGRFTAGNSGGGRKPISPEVREMLQASTPKAAQRLIDALDATMVVHHMGVEVGHYIDYGMRIKAASTILDRIFGKAAQPITGEDGKPLAIDIAPLLERLAR